MPLRQEGGTLNTVCVSQHGYQRARERLGLGKASFLRLAKKAISCGIPMESARGRLREYLDGLKAKNHKTDIRIYGENIFVFEGRFLVTVYRIPNELIRHLGRLRKK